MQLRDYQIRAVTDALDALDAGLNPVVQMPTGSGKSAVGAELCRAVAEKSPRGRSPSVISMTHTRELIRQNAACYRRYLEALGEEPDYAIYSAGLNEKRLDAPVVFAGVQSLANAELPESPRLFLIDEVHRVPDSDTTQYGRILCGHDTSGRIGLSATPYRTGRGNVHEGAWFDTLIQPVTTRELQHQGYLSPLSGVVSRDAVDVSGVHVRAGEFINSELEQVATDPECVERVCNAMLAHSAGRRAILVFAVSVAHAQALSARLSEMGESSAWISGQTPVDERDAILSAFSDGRLRFLVNCFILTTGYDYPGIDCVAVCRPTMSMSLWVQMVGRGLRKAEGKQDCKILDLGGNWRRHGRDLDGLPSDEMVDEPQQDAREKAAKENERLDKLYRFSLDTGEEDDDLFPPTIETRVYGISCKVQPNRSKPIHQVMVTYRTESGPITVWLLPEHDSKARWHSGRWFARRGMVMPATAEMTAQAVMSSPLPESISIRKESNFWKILVEHFS